MLIKLTQSNEIAQYPYQFSDLQRDNPNTGFPADLSAVDLSEFNAAVVEPTAAPAFDAITEVVSEGTPSFSEGKWRQVWIVSALNPSEIADKLVALKSAKNSQINAARLAANFTVFTHAGKTIACDQLSRSDIDGMNGFVTLYGSLPPGWPGGWKAVDNTYVAITTVAEWKAFYASMFTQGNTNFAKSQTLKASLAAATTAAQVQAIVW